MSEQASGPIITSKDDRLEQVARMADLLADRVLNAQIMCREVKESDVMALLEASLLLSEYGQETPPLVVEVVRRLDAARAGEGAGTSDEEERQDVERLAHSLRPFQEEKLNAGARPKCNDARATP